MSNPSGLRILVVDDDPSFRESIAVLLRSAGYDVVVAEDGLGTLSQLREISPDVIVSDLGMPGMAGYELLSEVRPLDESPSSVIAAGYYTKDGHPHNLFGTLERVIGSASIPSSCARTGLGRI